MKHYLDSLFADKSLNKTDVEIIWRARSCYNGYFDSQKRMSEWTGHAKNTVSRSITKLVESGYLCKTERGYEPVLEENYPPSESSYVGTFSSSDGTKSSSSGTESSYVGTRTTYNLLKPIKNKTPSEVVESPREASKKYPNLFFTKEHQTQLMETYKREGLSLKEGLEILSEYPQTSVQAEKVFNGYKSHYHVMRGWVLKECRRRQKDALDLERSKVYLDNAIKKENS